MKCRICKREAKDHTRVERTRCFRNFPNSPASEKLAFLDEWNEAHYAPDDYVNSAEFKNG